MDEQCDAGELVAQACRGDDEAARLLVRQLYPLVAKIVRAHRPVRTPEEDLCQMIFIKMFRKLGQFSGGVPLEHWLSRIAVNTCLNALAAEKVRPELRRADLTEDQSEMIDNLTAAPEETGGASEFAARDLVDHLLEQLAPSERLVMTLLHLEQKDVAEVAAITGWSKTLVKVRAFRARQKLRGKLARLTAEEKRYAVS